MTRFARLLFAVCALCVVVAGCGGDDSSSSSSTPGVVVVQDNKFGPKVETVAAGDTVTWRFTGQNAHNVTFDGFNSKLMKTGTFTHTFDKAGSYDYHCTIHVGMSGTVKVTEGSAP